MEDTIIDTGGHHCGCGGGACTCEKFNGADCECYDNCTCGCSPFQNTIGEPEPPYLKLIVGGMTCGGCISTVTSLLRPIKGITGDLYVDLNTRILFIPGTPNPEECINLLSQKGFKALVKENEIEVTKFMVKGLSCGSCTVLVASTLEKLKGVTGPVKVDLASGITIVPGKPDVNECIEELVIFNFIATVLGPITIDFRVEGITCRGCEPTVLTALKNIDGVLDVQFDFNTRIAVVCGNDITFKKCKEQLELFGYDASYTLSNVDIVPEKPVMVDPFKRKKKKFVKPLL